jgi:hypothetical protein
MPVPVKLYLLLMKELRFEEIAYSIVNSQFISPFVNAFFIHIAVNVLRPSMSYPED